jgi:hypothetical protein
MSKKRALFSLIIFFLMVMGLPEISYSVSALDGFNPDSNDIVRSIALQADGKILIGGQFTSIGGEERNRIARLNPDGSFETQAFNGSCGQCYRQFD